VAASAFIKTVEARHFLVAVRLYGTGVEFFDQSWKPDDGREGEVDGPGRLTRRRRAKRSAKSLGFVEAPGVEPARRMIRKPSTAPTCTVITRAWVIWNEAGEVGWESVRSGESGSSGRQAGDKISSVLAAGTFAWRRFRCGRCRPPVARELSPSARCEILKPGADRPQRQAGGMATEALFA
jgi:hypothetical protein